MASSGILFTKFMLCVRLLIIVNSVIIVTCQRDEDYPQRPDKCQAPPEFMYRQCCVFPPFFNREIAKNCGALFILNFVHGNITGFTRRTDSRCNHWKCVLNKYNLLSATGRLDDDKYFAHLEKWVELNPGFGNVMMNAKINCKMNYRHKFPMDPCDFYNFQGCIRNFINLDCPSYINTPQCNEVKDFNAECREFFN